jgi:hypothetical protein
MTKFKEMLQRHKAGVTDLVIWEDIQNHLGQYLFANDPKALYDDRIGKVDPGAIKAFSDNIQSSFIDKLKAEIDNIESGDVEEHDVEEQAAEAKPQPQGKKGKGDVKRPSRSGRAARVKSDRAGDNDRPSPRGKRTAVRRR